MGPIRAPELKKRTRRSSRTCPGPDGPGRATARGGCGPRRGCAPAERGVHGDRRPRRASPGAAENRPKITANGAATPKARRLPLPRSPAHRALCRQQAGWAQLCRALSLQPAGSLGPGPVLPKTGLGLEKPLRKHLPNAKHRGPVFQSALSPHRTLFLHLREVLACAWEAPLPRTLRGPRRARVPRQRAHRGGTKLRANVPQTARDRHRAPALLIGPQWAPRISVCGTPPPGNPGGGVGCGGVSPARLEDENARILFLASQTFSGF